MDVTVHVYRGSSAVAGPPAAGARMAAVLLHGLGRTARSARALARDLARRGFNAVTVDYPSRAADVDTLAGLVFDAVRRHPAIAGAPGVVVATHSLGGILLRAHLERHAWPALQRVVMLGPPNCGSEAADALSRWTWSRRALGPALTDLRTDPDSRVNRLPSWPGSVPLKIIAGTRSLDPWFAPFFSGPNDGKVAVDRTRLPGAAEHAVVPFAHPFLMAHRRARRLVMEFLGNSSCPSHGSG